MLHFCHHQTMESIGRVWTYLRKLSLFSQKKTGMKILESHPIIFYYTYVRVCVRTYVPSIDSLSHYRDVSKYRQTAACHKMVPKKPISKQQQQHHHIGMMRRACVRANIRSNMHKHKHSTCTFVRSLEHKKSLLRIFLTRTYVRTYIKEPRTERWPEIKSMPECAVVIYAYT